MANREPGAARTAAPWLLKQIAAFGVAVDCLTNGQAHTLLLDLRRGKTPEQAADDNALMVWTRIPPSEPQIGYMKKLELPWRRPATPRQAGLLLDAGLDPLKCYNRLVRDLDKADTLAEIDRIAREVLMLRGVLPQDDYYEPLLFIGRERRMAVAKELAEKENW